MTLQPTDSFQKSADGIPCCAYLEAVHKVRYAILVAMAPAPVKALQVETTSTTPKPASVLKTFSIAKKPPPFQSNASAISHAEISTGGLASLAPSLHVSRRDSYILALSLMYLSSLQAKHTKTLKYTQYQIVNIILLNCSNKPRCKYISYVDQLHFFGRGQSGSRLTLFFHT